MDLKVLEKLFLKLLKKCSKLPFREQLAFLLKKAREADSEELKIIIFLYVNYLVEQQNTKGRTPFVLPSLSEIREVSAKLKEKEVELDDLVKSPEPSGKIDLGKSLYLDSTPSLSIDAGLYHDSSSDSSFYKESYVTGSSEQSYTPSHEKMEGDAFREPSPLENSLEGSGKRKNEIDTGYMEKKRKKEEEKVLYG